MAVTSTLSIFKAIQTLLRDTFVYDVAALPVDGGGNPIWPVVGLDRVILFLGDPEEAVETAVTRLRDGHYGIAALLSFATLDRGQEEDAGGQEFSNAMPVQVILIKATGNREQQGNLPLTDEDWEELDFVQMCTIHDAVYLTLTLDNLPPEDLGAMYFQWLNTFTVGGTSAWKGIRLVYNVEREVTK